LPEIDSAAESPTVDEAMTPTRKLILLIAGLAASLLVGLRVYWVYHNESQGALLRAQAAEDEARAMAERIAENQHRIAEGQRRLDCAEQWLKYKIAQQKLQIAKYRCDPCPKEGTHVPEPLCSNYKLPSEASFNEVLEPSIQQLEFIEKKEQLTAYAGAERFYAAHRSFQTRRLGRKLWLFVTGTSESQQEWVQFLSKCCGQKDSHQ
jgi:hypothetical protein